MFDLGDRICVVATRAQVEPDLSEVGGVLEGKWPQVRSSSAISALLAPSDTVESNRGCILVAWTAKFQLCTNQIRLLVNG